MSKHIFFDLDKTLTMSRRPMAPAHQEIFERLCAVADVIVVTGGTVEQIREQITPRFNGKYYTLAQSGNQALAKDGATLWDEKLSDEQIASALEFISLLRKHFNITVKDETDIVESRGAQIAYSVLGFHEDIAKKYAFDPDESKRQNALKQFDDERQALLKVGVEVVPAGTTNFSFIPAGKHKGTNVDRLRELTHWRKEDCLYVGDALFPGGNDAVVVGVVPTHAVKDPDETFDFVQKNLLSS
ncbi:HAD-IIB family hydrolase [Candidatus Kaiserbacteria bacterium]|nr:HAD-IIB family hydrolase [Candidatus Kaiserbacteria bacterium]